MKTAAIVAAATVGDGIFALPFVFAQAGWLTGLFYLLVLAALVSLAHVVYFETLQKVGERSRLLGLAEKYFGRGGFWTGFLAIVVGLLLTLVAYLILGTQFIHLALPSVTTGAGLLIFWLFTTIPVFASDRRIVELEVAGIACTSLVIIFIFVTAWPAITFAGVPAVNIHNLFLPFGAVLFSLAGWTSVEPAYESRASRKKKSAATRVWRALASGTFFAALLYLLFASGILGSAPSITPDTISGLAQWPVWKKEIIAICGLIAVATVYMPIAREIKNALEKDLKWSKLASRATILFVPIILILAGFNNFLVIVGLVGGLFVGTQYILIISVGRRALTLSAAKKFLLDVVALLFVIAAVYEVWTFVVH